MGVPRTLKQVLQTGAELGRVRIEAPKAPRGVGCGEGVSPSPLGVRSGEGAVSPPQKMFAIFLLKRACFGAF